MCYVSYLRTPVAVSGIVLLLSFTSAPAARAQKAPPDPVAELRRVLKTGPLRDAEMRKQELAKRAEALKTPSELRRALVLQEWRDEDPDETIRKVDRAVRGDLANRFESGLHSVLRSGDAAAQLAAANMLADLGITAKAAASKGSLAQSFAPDLAGLLKAGSPLLREASARALGQIYPNPAVAVPALAGLLQTGLPSERVAAADGLLNLIRVVSQLAARTKIPTGVEASRGDLVEVARSVVPVAASGLNDADPDVRRRCAETLREAASNLDRQIDVRLPEDPAEAESYRKQVEEQRKELMDLLQAFRGQAKALGRALRDPNAGVRQQTALALEDLAHAYVLLYQRPAGTAPVDNPLLQGFQEVLPPLSAAVADPDPQVRLAALDVLETLGPDAASVAPAVIKALGDSDSFVRWAAARSLGRIGPVDVATAVPALARLLFDPDLDVNLAAAASLEQFGEAARPAVPDLIRRLETASDAEMRVALIHSLAGIGPAADASIPAIAKALADPDARVRQGAAEALGNFGSAARSTIPALERALNDNNADVRRAASDALLTIVQPGER